MSTGRLKPAARLTAQVRRRWERHGRHRLARPLRPAAEFLGFDLVDRHFYSPIPDIEALPRKLWERPAELHALNFSVAEQMDILERELAPYLSEFDPPSHPTGRAGEFYLHNGYYGPVDAEVLYAMVRRWKPRRVIELGSGASSLVIGAACRANAKESCASDYRVFDPFPEADPTYELVDLQRAIEGLARVHAVPATEVPLDEFRALHAGDVLFVDTTHTVKTGGDVNYVILEVLPSLRAGVIVHFHDIFLPFEYPYEWLAHMRRYWAEQYLLQAFLAFNAAFEVLFASHAVMRAFPTRMARLVSSVRTEDARVASAFWLRRRRENGAPPL